MNAQYNHIMSDWKYEIYIYFPLKNGSLTRFECTYTSHLKYDDDLQFLRIASLKAFQREQQRRRWNNSWNK